MVLNELITSIGSRLGYTIDSNSKPDTTEVTDFIHQAMRVLVELLPDRVLDGGKTFTSLTADGSGELTVPTDFGRFVSLYNATQGKPYQMVDTKYLGYIKNNVNSILFPDYPVIHHNNKFVIANYTVGDNFRLDYIKQYDPADIEDYDNQLSPLVVTYVAYKAKSQDEETAEAQALFNEFQGLLQGMGGVWKVLGNE